MRLEEIEGRLTSEDIAVLKQSLALGEKWLARERERGSRAETRATAMLATLGVISGLVISQADTVATKSGNGDEQWFLMVSFATCFLFLVKGLFYAMKVIGIERGYQIIPDEMTYGFQGLSPVEALRKEIAGVLWTYRKAIQPTTDKLFWLNRCQRSVVVAVLLLVFFGMAVIVTRNDWFEPSLGAAVVMGVIIAILFFVVDPAVERLGGMWNT